ncbi:pentatricopeptide repeat-containing protein At4g02750-like [Aristolochia californica]|uniref:pentatricopeptide repeat-containing protein At4g02750-like n=1 Tax=Aristolochia californica TaxID=171875 RepID=UPI0035E039E3
MVHNEGILPNQVTFTGVLSACSYSGFVQKGRQLFNEMVHMHNIRPSAEHHTCMVDMLARAGLLEEAEAFLMHLPFEPDNVMWGTMLGACKKYGEFVVAKRVAKRLLVVEPENSSAYVLLANLFAGGCEWVEAVGIREAMQEKGARKELARSWVQIRDTVHSFVAGDMYHHQTEEIIEVLQRLRLQMAGEIIGFDSIPS